MKKHLAFYLGWSAFLLLLAGCEQSDSPTESAGNGAPVTVDFTVADIADYGEKQQAGSRVESTSAPFSVSTPINDEYEMEATFTPDPSATSRAAATRAALGEGIYYRVAAYNDGGYVGHADYKITNASSSLVSNPLTLEPGTYSFLAYSHNNNSPITDNDVASEWGDIAVNIDNDVLYWEETKTISTHTALSISFKHLFMQMKVKFDATELGCDFKTASATLNAAGSSSLYKAGEWVVGTNGFNNMSIKHVPNLHFSNISGQTITSDSQRLLPYGTSNMALTVNVGFTAGGGMADVNKTLNLASIDLKRNYSYTCTVKFKPSGISLDGNDVDGYPHGGGNCWVIGPRPEVGSNIYSFDATKEGDSANPVGTQVKPNDATRVAKLVWTDFPEVITEQPVYKNGRIRIGLGADIGSGNVLVSVTDGTGKILWSWHIWLTSQILTAYETGDFFTVNLGSSTMVYSEGLFYQYGRKDPIRPESEVNQIMGPVSTEYVYEIPDKFILSSNGYWSTTSVAGNWMVPGNNPCPKGFLPPTQAAFSGMTLANVGTSWGPGYFWKNKGSSYMAGGKRSATDGKIYDKSIVGYYFSTTQMTSDKVDIFFMAKNDVKITNGSPADGYYIRCVKK